MRMPRDKRLKPVCLYCYKAMLEDHPVYLVFDRGAKIRGPIHPACVNQLRQLSPAAQIHALEDSAVVGYRIE